MRSPLSVLTSLIRSAALIGAALCFGPVYAQAYSDCSEAGGIYGDCREPSLGPWSYSVWGATALPNLTYCGPFATEAQAVDCAKSTITSANVGPYPNWCGVTFTDSTAAWAPYASYYGWTQMELRTSSNFTWTAPEYQSTNCVPSGVIGYIAIVRSRLVHCPASHPYLVMRPDGRGVCFRLARNSEANVCTKPTSPHPVRISDRTKLLGELDYTSPSSPLLRFERRYASNRSRNVGVVSAGFGGGWKTNFDRSIRILPGSNPARAVHTDPDDRVQSFANSAPGSWSPAQEVAARLRQLFDGGGSPAGWSYVGQTPEVEEFDAEGRLVRVTAASGHGVQLTYRPNGDVASVADQFGRSLLFQSAADISGAKYSATMIDPASNSIQYYFDGAGPGTLPPAAIRSFDLSSVIYQDGAQRRYHYGEPDHFVIPDGYPLGSTWMFNFLTGVTDELGVRLADYTYEYTGRVLSTSRAGGTGRYLFAPILNQDGTTVTDPLGTRRDYYFNFDRLQSVSQPAGAGSGPCASSIAYETATGLPIEYKQFNGNATCQKYDPARRLVVARVEGARNYCTDSFFTTPPAGARVVSQQWHPDWALLTRIAEAKKLTTIVYNGQGATCAPSTVLVDGMPPAVVCSRSEQATTDETGAAGFGATTTGTARTWSYTYTTYGRVLTATDPNGKTTTTAYHPDNDPDLGRRGNVATVTNAAGHVTHYTAYNAHGQPTQIIDPNGLVTDLTYDARMRLTSRKVGNELTSFGYDSVGQLTSVTLPDGASLAYTYDTAHRLTAIQDHRGNRVVYTLDAMGNRINEQVTDPAGALVKNIQRSIDALNRVQQVVGVQQW